MPEKCSWIYSFTKKDPIKYTTTGAQKKGNEKVEEPLDEATVEVERQIQTIIDLLKTEDEST